VRNLDDFPEDWLDVDRDGAPRLRRDRKSYVTWADHRRCQLRDRRNRSGRLVDRDAALAVNKS
jgi:hypothetical protein